jgi:hypothetical protein
MRASRLIGYAMYVRKQLATESQPTVFTIRSVASVERYRYEHMFSYLCRDVKGFWNTCSRTFAVLGAGVVDTGVVHVRQAMHHSGSG